MRARDVVIHGVAFASGVAALLYQVVWMRWFQVLFGSTAYAASATLCAFFAGLAIGAAYFGRRSRTIRRPLRAFAGIEAGAALVALLVPFVFAANDAIYPFLYDRLSDSPGAFVVTKFALAMLVMLPPSILLGGSFPLLTAGSIAEAGELGTRGTRLYAINTLGAASGSLIGSLWLPEAVGVRTTYAIAMACSLAAAATALGLERGARRVSADARPADPPPPAPGARLSLRAISFASGFGTLAFEVLLIHAIALRLDHSVYSHGVVLFAVLICLALGAQFVAWTAHRVRVEALLGFAWSGVVLSILLVPFQLRSYETAAGMGGVVRGLDAALWLGAPALLFGALILPLTFRLAEDERGAAGHRVGGLLAVNTVGGILGSLVASFVLLAWFGVGVAFAIVALVYAVVAVACAPDVTRRWQRGAVFAVAFAAIFLSPLDPRVLPPVELAPGDRLVDLREGPYGAISVIDHAGGRVMKMNNHYTLSGSGVRDALKERAGHIPLLLHPDPGKVLFIGSATGHTAGAAVLHDVEEIGLVEIIPAVHDLAAEHFAASNRDVYRDPRARRIVEDGRNHLRATDETYDVIVGDLFSPWRPGVGALYAREHFEAVRERLTRSGVFCQWFPLYQHREESFASVAASFLEVFPEAHVFRADFYRKLPRVALVAFKGETPKVEAVNARIRAFAAQGISDRWVSYPRAFWMLYAGPLAAAGAPLLEAVPTSDDRPQFEYLAGRTTGAEIERWLFRRWPAWHARLTDAALAGGDFAAARAAVRSGANLLKLNALETARDRAAHESEIQRLREGIPAPLRSPDPSALEYAELPPS